MDVIMRVAILGWLWHRKRFPIQKSNNLVLESSNVSELEVYNPNSLINCFRKRTHNNIVIENFV